jgi:hypothetical protein
MISAGAFVSLGYALSYWSVFGFAYVNNTDAAWRVPIALQITFALPAMAMLLFLPDSPRWLILTGREQEALTVIAALNDDDPDGYEVKDEFLQIKDAILVMAQGSTSKLFSNKDRRGFHRVILAFLVQIFQQGTGINLVLQYLSWIFLTRMGYAGWLARLLASCSATAYFLASFVTVVGIDRFWGRRSLMMFGASGMSGCMVILTITQYLYTIQEVNAARIASTVFLFVFSMFFAIGWQGMAWLYQVEIVPLRIRGPANALSTLGNWLINFVIVFITPIAFANIGYRTWIIFAATNFTIVPLIYFFFPETAFRSLEEVDVIFFLADEAPGNPWRNAVRISLHEPLWFGKKGENRIGFDYANSSWHRKLMETASSGSGTGSDEKRDRKSKKNGSSDSSGSSGSDTVVPQPTTTTEKRLDSESPVDPMLFSQDHSPSDTLTTTLASHRNRSHSRERHLDIKQDRNLEVLTPDSDPAWYTSDLAPTALRVSNPPSERNRPYSSDSATHRGFHYPDHAAQPTDSDAYPALQRPSVDYPGRLGIRRMENGGETYWADGVEGIEEGRQRGSRGSDISREARGAGRAY